MAGHNAVSDRHGEPDRKRKSYHNARRHAEQYAQGDIALNADGYANQHSYATSDGDVDNCCRNTVADVYRRAQQRNKNANYRNHQNRRR